MPPDSQSFQPPTRPIPDYSASDDVMIVEDDLNNAADIPVETATDMMKVGNNIAHSSTTATTTTIHKSQSRNNTNIIDDNNYPSTSSARMLTFNVQYCDRTIKIQLPENGTVVDLKNHLYKEVKVSPCRQLLSGWARMKQYENTPFSKLMIPDENNIQLTIKQNDDGVTADDE